ncbi:MAG: hypothetical protein J5646_02170 [Bacteroidales bacterium]|nr:hypothetical protein [Bacteroidales bacterium]
MNSDEIKINQEENLKDIIPKSNEQQNQTEKIQKVNHCLPSFLTDDDYFKDNSNSLEEEESNEEKSVDNKKDNSTREDSNKILNYPQNNILYSNNNVNNNVNNDVNINNNINQYNANHNLFLNEKNNLMMNQNNNFNNFNMNFFNRNNNIDYQHFYNNNNNNNISIPFNSFNNIYPQWNSFSGINPINAFNYQNINNTLPLSFNNDLNNNNSNLRCISFNNGQIPINNKKNLSQKYKSIKIEKLQNEDKNNNNNKSSSNLSIKKLLDMNGQTLYNYIITQKGSREVQNIIKKVNENEVELIISKIKNYFSDITIDKYGNYFSKKLIQICLPSQRIQLLESINNRFVEIANNSFGTHPLQSLIEIINMPEEKKLVLKYILNNESELALDSKGTHVLQKFISCTKDEERNELNQNLINLIDRLIINPFGVCVLIQLVKHSKDKNIAKKLANYITNGDPLSFIQHPYANYAVQSLLSNTDLAYCDVIIETIVQNYLSLSMQKFSSNVVENCIKYGKENTVKKIFKNIVEQEKLESLLNNNYGNFVLEKLIARLNKEEKMIFIKKIEKLGKTKIISNTIKNLLYK